MIAQETKPKVKQRDFLANYRDSLNQLYLLQERPEYRAFFEDRSAELYRVSKDVREWNARFPPLSHGSPGALDKRGIYIDREDIGYWELSIDAAEVIYSFLKGCREKFGLRFVVPFMRLPLEYLAEFFDPDEKKEGIPDEELYILARSLLHSYDSYKSSGQPTAGSSYAKMQRRIEPDFDNHVFYAFRCMGYSSREIASKMGINEKTVEKKFLKHFHDVHGREYDPTEDRTRLPDPPGWKDYLRDLCKNCEKHDSCEETCEEINDYADKDTVYLRDLLVSGGVIEYPRSNKVYGGPEIPLPDYKLDIPIKELQLTPPAEWGKDLIRHVSKVKYEQWKWLNHKHPIIIEEGYHPIHMGKELKNVWVREAEEE